MIKQAVRKQNKVWVLKQIIGWPSFDFCANWPTEAEWYNSQWFHVSFGGLLERQKFSRQGKKKHCEVQTVGATALHFGQYQADKEFVAHELLPIVHSGLGLFFTQPPPGGKCEGLLHTFPTEMFVSGSREVFDHSRMLSFLLFYWWK